MSMHKVPLTQTEEAGIRAHGLQRCIGKPSQLVDVFRQGVAWGIAAQREAAEQGLKVGAEIDRLREALEEIAKADMTSSGFRMMAEEALETPNVGSASADE